MKELDQELKAEGRQLIFKEILLDIKFCGAKGFKPSSTLPPPLLSVEISVDGP
jgi:hypothetical protein